MSSIATTAVVTTPSATPARHRTPTWRFGVATGAVAATTTVGLVAVLRAVGVPFEVGGEGIPLVAFAQMVLLGTVIGTVLARRTRTTTFIRATVLLTVASCFPSVALGTGSASKLALVLTHVVAAAIVVPALARRQGR
ncbi:DUF6069 family protein [Nocardioides sp.]|uniref:DUF6069 family protein n=1 Tax=Nocardioides sp. TaxID=35761 RepID=UPI0031FE5254|nr:cell envelope biosis protein OmpA [Nocardioides sp.]